jgi:hypothetical protein
MVHPQTGTWMAPLSRSASISNLVRHLGNCRHGNPTLGESEQNPEKMVIESWCFQIPKNHHSFFGGMFTIPMKITIHHH